MGPGLLICALAQIGLAIGALAQGYKQVCLPQFGGCTTVWDIHIGWFIAIGVFGVIQLSILILMGFELDGLRENKEPEPKSTSENSPPPQPLPQDTSNQTNEDTTPPLNDVLDNIARRRGSNP